MVAESRTRVNLSTSITEHPTSDDNTYAVKVHFSPNGRVYHSSLICRYENSIFESVDREWDLVEDDGVVTIKPQLSEHNDEEEEENSNNNVTLHFRQSGGKCNHQFEFKYADNEDDEPTNTVTSSMSVRLKNIKERIRFGISFEDALDFDYDYEDLVANIEYEISNGKRGIEKLVATVDLIKRGSWCDHTLGLYLPGISKRNGSIQCVSYRGFDQSVADERPNMINYLNLIRLDNINSLTDDFVPIVVSTIKNLPPDGDDPTSNARTRSQSRPKWMPPTTYQLILDFNPGNEQLMNTLPLPYIDAFTFNATTSNKRQHRKILGGFVDYSPKTFEHYSRRDDLTYTFGYTGFPDAVITDIDFDHCRESGSDSICLRSAYPDILDSFILSYPDHSFVNMTDIETRLESVSEFGSPNLDCVLDSAGKDKWLQYHNAHLRYIQSVPIDVTPVYYAFDGQPRSGELAIGGHITSVVSVSSSADNFVVTSGSEVLSSNGEYRRGLKHCFGDGVAVLKEDWTIEYESKIWEGRYFDVSIVGNQVAGIRQVADSGEKMYKTELVIDDAIIDIDQPVQIVGVNEHIVLDANGVAIRVTDRSVLLENVTRIWATSDWVYGQDGAVIRRKNLIDGTLETVLTNCFEFDAVGANWCALLLTGDILINGSTISAHHVHQKIRLLPNAIMLL